MDAVHVAFMQRAIALAKKGMRAAYPNPSVGAVVVYNGKIIGEGFTSAYGGPHAEVNAINAVKDTALLSNASLYVTLEPCSHYGKTPPCSLLIIEKQIPKIFIGCVDSFSEVSGRGIKMLLEAGREVRVGLLEEDCLALHKRFLTFHNQQRPYVFLKWAQTKDGFIDVDRVVSTKKQAKPTWISNSLSRQHVHQLRAKEHAILIGTNTAIKDNPSLTTRSVGGLSPVRVLIDRALRVPENYQLYDGTVATIVFTEKKAKHPNVVYKEIDFSKSIMTQILKILHQENIQSVLVEGGKQILESLIEEDLWDEAYVYQGVAAFGSGIKAPKLDVLSIANYSLENDSLFHYKNTK